MSTFTGVQALELLIEGKRLRRVGWGSDYLMIAYNNVDGKTHRFIKHIRTVGNVEHQGSFCGNDLLSDDWEIAPNEIPCPCCKSIVKRW
jgi:hypothetical protein